MNKAQRIEYQKSLETYLESNNVYEIFEKMLINLMKDMPDNPLDYMVQKLGQPERTILISNSCTHYGASRFKQEGSCTLASRAF